MMRILLLCLLLLIYPAQAQDAAQKAVRLTPNLSYGREPLQRYDVYHPETAVNAPVIVFFHGGAWQIGDKKNARVVANKMNHFVSRGAIFISVNYRMLPDADVYTQAQDVASALADIQDRAAGWGGDITKMAVMGHSAGAHLVMLVQSDPSLSGSLKPWAATVALDSAAYDVAQIMNRRHLPLYDRAFGDDPAYWSRVSPYDALSGAIPPSLLVCSSKRRESCPVAEAYAQKAVEFGNAVSVEAQFMTHEQINEKLGFDRAYTNSVDAFLRRHRVF